MRKSWTIQESAFQSRTDAETLEDGRRQCAAAFTGDEHVGAGRAFGIGQHAVFLHDERASQRHHHQHAEQPAGGREHQDLKISKVAGAVRRQEDERRNGEDHTAGDRFTGRADRLHDVVFEDRGTAQPLQHRDGEHGDRNRCADGQSGAQPQVDRRRAEEQPEQRADDDRLQRELGRRLRTRRDVRLKPRSRAGRRCAARTERK